MNVDNLANRQIEAGLWNGAVVLAGNNEKVLFSKPYGLAQTAPEAVKMQLDSLFDIASVTKVLGTAAACAVCADQGKLDFDAPFTEYLPEYSGKGAADITVRDLATHVSGFDNSKPYLNVKECKCTLADMLQTSPVRARHTEFEYSCINFILLGLIVEKLSGQSLNDFCQEHIFKPLAMRDTCWGPLSNFDVNRMVKMPGANLGRIADEGANIYTGNLGHAGIFSTAPDITKFCEMVLNNGASGSMQIISETGIRELTTNSLSDNFPQRSFGWDMSDESRPAGCSDKTILHSGYTGQTVWIDRGKNVYIIVLTNRTGDWAQAKIERKQLASEVLKAIL